MGLFDFFRAPDINQGVNEYKAAAGAVLLDVRTKEEFTEGHVPGAKNIPLQAIDRTRDVIQNKDIPLYVYCYSGARSSQAVMLLKRMGYNNVKNIGGFASYIGKVER